VLLPYVLLLVPEELANGRVVGDVEAVTTGQHRAVTCMEDLLRFLSDTANTYTATHDSKG
jgi:RNase adaptor protein for sRNA GlmZ degradation